jgi:translocation and assembly module TamA
MLKLSTILACACGMALIVMADAAFASDTPPAFYYDIELQVPLAQRKLLEEHLDLYSWRSNERMNETQLQRLVQLAPKQIRELLATEGFYSPVIEAYMQHSAPGWRVMLLVDPGRPVRVGRFTLHVTGPFNDNSAENRARLEEMQANWNLRPDAVFRHDDWESAKRDALKRLLIDGYPTATIADSHATVNLESMRVELRLTLDSGPLFTFGALEIEGLERYPESLVRRMSSIVAGEPYSQTRLLELQARLQDSPNFSSVEVNADIDPAHPLEVPVRVRVSEYQSRKLGFGIGMSTDTGVRGQIDYRDLNFLDRAWQLGGTLKLEQKRQSLNNDLLFPLSEQRFRDSINTLLEHTDIEGEETEKLVLGAKRTFIHERNETAYGLRYFIERHYIAGAASGHSAALSPSFSFTLREVDHILYPTLGYVINAQADTAARTLLSDQDFFRGYGRAVYFYPLGENDQLTLRGELGVVAAISRKGIPSDFLFRTGGDQTIRGYAYQSLGVHEGGAVVGGRYLTLASAEYVHWLKPRWGAAIFVDRGNAADEWDLMNPVYGYGVGARWKSPVGPLNLDYAYGEAVRQMRIHFSVGFSF